MTWTLGILAFERGIQSALAPHRYIFVTVQIKERNVYVICLYTIKCCLLSLLFMYVFDIRSFLMMHIFRASSAKFRNRKLLVLVLVEDNLEKVILVTIANFFS